MTSNYYIPSRQPPASAGKPTLIDPYNNAKQAMAPIFGLFTASVDGADGLGNTTATSALAIAWWTLGTAGIAAGAYHGYKRNNSIGWAIAWALLGGMFPFVTIPVSFAQGFGKRA